MIGRSNGTGVVDADAKGDLGSFRVTCSVGLYGRAKAKEPNTMKPLEKRDSRNDAHSFELPRRPHEETSHLKLSYGASSDARTAR